MKKLIHILIALLCCTMLIGIVACNKNDSNRDSSHSDGTTLPPDEPDFVIYDIAIDSDYSLFFNDEGYCDFVLPIYSSVRLAAEKLTIKSVDGQNTMGIDVSIAQFEYGEIIADKSNTAVLYDFIENTVTVRLTKKVNSNISENITLTKLSFDYAETEYSTNVNVMVFPIAINTVYPSPFDNGGILKLQYSDTKQEILAFIGNPTSSITLNSYELLAHDFLTLNSSSWHGGGGVKPITIEGKLTSSVSFDKSSFCNMEVYLTFEFYQVITPWFSDVLVLSITTFDSLGETNYSMAFTIQCFVDLDVYYNNINKSIKASKTEG